jgi:hypothetical protein
MNCREFRELMPGLKNHELDHARECPACAAFLERHAALANGLAAVSAEWRRLEAPPRLESRLASAFRGNHGLAFRPRHSGIWVPILTWAAATAAIVALATFLVRERRPEPAQRRTPHRTVEMASYQAPDFSIYTQNGFIPLPTAAAADENEDFNLVRVELPRSSMIALGYVVPPERATEMVQADVMLGSDGVARAVRFLDE